MNNKPDPFRNLMRTQAPQEGARALDEMSRASESTQVIHALLTQMTIFEARACVRWMEDTLQSAMLIVPDEQRQMEYTVEQACLKPSTVDVEKL